MAKRISINDTLKNKHFTYFQDFKINDKQDAKKISELYDITNNNITLKKNGDYKFKLFSMCIKNNLFKTKNCTDITIDNTHINSPINDDSAKEYYKNLYERIKDKLREKKFNNICSKITIKYKQGAEKNVIIEILNNENNLKKLLESINDYDIINFQEISIDNIKKINQSLNLKEESKYRCVFLKCNNDVFLTTFYDINKFTLLGYKIKKTKRQNIYSYILYLKMNDDLRILCVENSIKEISYTEKKPEMYELEVNTDNSFVFYNKENKLELDLSEINTKEKLYFGNIYKTFYIFCGKIREKLIITNDDGRNSSVDHPYIKNNDDNNKQHIKNPQYNDKHIIDNFINDIIIFNNNLQIGDDLYKDVLENLKNVNKIQNSFVSVLVPEEHYNRMKAENNDAYINIKKFKDLFKYLGYSQSLPMGVEFNLGVDNFTFKPTESKA
jgi:hypothetical protein